MIKKLLSTTTVAMLAGLGLTFAATGTSSAATLTPAADAAFGDVSRCLTSGTDKKLDVLYLIDTSGSLDWTDPDNERKQILESSIEQLGGFANEGIETGLAAYFFSSNVQELQPWTLIGNRDDAARISEDIGSYINNGNAGGTTDWEAGLEVAYEELSSRGDSCKMLIWFTDGGINPNNEPNAALDSLSRLCRPGISEASLGGGSFGLMSDFREAGIPVFGVLYANIEASLDYWSSQFGPDEAKAIVDEEIWRMSFMKPLVEGRGVIARTSAGFVDGTLDCAEVNSQGLAPIGQANGAFLNAEDPVALAYQFLKLQAQITGGSSNDVTLSGFTVPEGAAKFTLLVDSDDWRLSGPEGSSFSASPAQYPNNLEFASSGSASSITVTTATDDLLFGEWKLETNAAEVDLFVYSGLTLVLDRDRTSKVLSDFENTLSGRVVRTSEFEGVPIQLGSFEDKTFELTYLSAGTRNPVQGVTVSVEEGGEFTIEGFNPDGAEEQIELFINLSLGSNFSDVESQFTLQVQDKNALAKLSTDTLLLSNLVGPDGVASGTFVLEGPNTSANSLFCFTGQITRLDDAQTGVEKVERLDGFKFAVNGEALLGSPVCFDVGQNQELPVTMEVKNTTQADSSVVAILGITSDAVDSGVSFEAPIRVEFTSETQSNQAVALGAIILLLILGLLGPLLVLGLINLLTTRFLPVEGVVRSSFPIKVQPGMAAKIVDANSGGSIVADAKDFKFVSPQGASRSYNTGSGPAVARVPFFPLSSTWYEWQSPSGSRVIGGYASASKRSKKLSSGKAVEISPNMGENWALVMPEDEIRKPSTEEISGELVIFANSGKLTDYQSRIGLIVNKPGLRQNLTNLSKSLIEEEKPAKSNGSYEAKGPGGPNSEMSSSVPGVPKASGSQVPSVPSAPGSSVPRPPTPPGVPRPPIQGGGSPSVPKPPIQPGSSGGGVPKPPGAK